MAGVSRGRVGDAGTMAQELLGREASRAQLRAEARTSWSTRISGQSRQMGGDPSAFLFGRPTQQTQMGSTVIWTSIWTSLLNSKDHNSLTQMLVST